MHIHHLCTTQTKEQYDKGIAQFDQWYFTSERYGSGYTVRIRSKRIVPDTLDFSVTVVENLTGYGKKESEALLQAIDNLKKHLIKHSDYYVIITSNTLYFANPYDAKYSSYRSELPYAKHVKFCEPL